MQIQSNVKSARILPDGTEIPALALATVDDKAWADHKIHPVVAAWLDTGVLSEVKAKPDKGETKGDKK